MFLKAAGGALLMLSCGTPTTAPRPANSPKPAPVAITLSAEQHLTAGDDAFDVSNYSLAESHYRACAAQPATRLQAELGLARVQFATGRYADVTELQDVAEAPDDLRAARAVLKARAFAAIGKLSEASDALSAAEQLASTEAILRHAEVLLEQGQRSVAEPRLMQLIQSYNNSEVDPHDSDALAFVARAAQLLRSPEDANDAFNLAEQAGNPSEQTLIWRAELFLDNYDPGHAAEVLEDLLKRAPNQPEALALAARVRIEEALDFDQAERLARSALNVNPNSVPARAVLGALNLRDTDLTTARQELETGLRVNPRNLTLLSLLGAVAFLSDDAQELERLEHRVLELNKEYSTFYTLVGLYAEWEHRYDDIVHLTSRAVTVDARDALAWAQLGLNQIRSGDDTRGVDSLQVAFGLNPYNVRVFNTLNLYEKVIPKQYTDTNPAPFRIRYPKDERAVLERYVPQLLRRAWGKLIDYYQFTPTTPIGVELYSERSHFAIRTSGLPDTAIQGVCFGKTLASITPRSETFNLAMTLWHELSHVFHIQLSRNHVPRWFTEGLAEYETLVERKEWKREQDAELFAALRDKRLPKIGAMNEAFTHAEELSDVAVAYYASTQIVTMLVEDYGRDKIRQMLVLWGEGKTTEQVVETALGIRVSALDVRFEQYLTAHLERYKTQFLPNQRVGNPEQALSRARSDRKNPAVLARVALLALSRGDLGSATEAVDAALALDANHADAVWIKGSIALREGNFIVADSSAQKLIRLGHDGYETRLLSAHAAEARGDEATVQHDLALAHAFDPSERAAIEGLRNSAQRTKALDQDEQWLRKLVQLDEHDGSAHRELLRRLLTKGDVTGAAELSTAALYSDMENPETHQLVASAFEASKDWANAERELEAAQACPSDPRAAAQTERASAAYWQRRNNPQRAASHLQRASQLEAEASPAD